MALIDCQFFSNVLGLTCSMKVILPQVAKPPKKHPVLLLLHGMSDNETGWTRYTSIERYANSAGLAVIMPDANLSWYQDMASGLAYRTFLLDELPQIAQSFFPISSLRKDNFVAGLSMGGYGAFLLALTKPERFAFAASLSGALDMATRALGSDKGWQTMMRTAFGPTEKIRGGPSDLLYLAKKLARSSGPKPKFYACCGTADFLFEANQAFAAHAKKIGFPLAYEEHPGASHDWGYWDQQIQEVIKRLPLKRPA